MRNETGIIRDTVKHTACEADPDKWFTTLPSGRTTKRARHQLVMQAKEAREACFSCPVIQQCGELGMLEENIKFGIWGGKMVAQRMIEVHDYPERYAAGTLERAEYRLWKLVEYASV